MKNYTARKALAAALCLSMLPAFSACKKNQTKKNASREIKETDPYYDSETVELSIPVDETKELQWIQVSDVEYADTEIRMPYYINYEIPKEAYADMNFDFSAYSYGGLAVFDLNGNLISNEKQGEGSIGSECSTIDNEGNHKEVDLRGDGRSSDRIGCRLLWYRRWQKEGLGGSRRIL